MRNLPLFVGVGLFTYVYALPLRNQTDSTDAVSHNALGRDEPRQGWTSSPRNRGTVDILWSCGSTIILCCWSILCLNVPGAQDTNGAKFRRKVWIFLLTLGGPEVVCSNATGQYLLALQSVKDFKVAGIADWSLQHAFFADMGGFVLQTRDWVPFPVTAKQLLWLIQRGYVSISPAMSGHIKDKNKVDAIMRCIMVLQTIWFLANFLARIAQGLAITTIELTTVAFVYCSLPTMFVWRHKPANVDTAEILVADASMAEILLAGGDAARRPYSSTPLDFIDRREWFRSKYSSHLEHGLRRLHIAAGSTARPVDRFSNLNAPELPPWLFGVGAVYYFGFSGIFLAGWNLSLPTRTEQLLWRMAGLLCILALLAAEAVTQIAFTVWPYIKARAILQCKDVAPDERGPRNPRSFDAPRPRRRTIWHWMRNNSAAQDPQLTIPLKVILPMWVLSITYFMARAYIIIEDFLELRSLPQSCYQTPNWQGSIPHFG